MERIIRLRRDQLAAVLAGEPLRLPVTPRTSTVNGGPAAREWTTLGFASPRVVVDPGFADDGGEYRDAYLKVPVIRGSWKGARYRVRSRIGPDYVLRDRSGGVLEVLRVRPEKVKRGVWNWVYEVCVVDSSAVRSIVKSSRRA